MGRDIVHLSEPAVLPAPPNRVTVAASRARLIGVRRLEYGAMADEPQPGAESRTHQALRYANRTRLYGSAALGVVVLVLLVILVAQNTRHVRVGWVFGHSNVSLVFLVLFATILGWLLGIATSILLRQRTRRPR